MNNAQPNTPNQSLSALPLAVLLTVALAVRFPLALRALPDGLFDDAYITLRYAANLASGQGFVFNVGEHVWGTTAPLFTFLLTIAAKLFGVGSLESAAVTLGILPSLGVLVFTALLLHRARVEPLLVWPYLSALALLPSFVINSISGMETPVVMLLMAATFFVYMRGRLVLLAFLAGLLFLTRMDTGIWLAVLGAHLLFERRLLSFKHTCLCLVIFFATILPWFTFAYFYFGSIIPQSLAGKAVSHGSFQSVDTSYILAFSSIYFPLTRLGPLAWIGLAVLVVIALLGAIHLWERYPDLRPLASYFFAFNVFFLVSKAPLFSWYFPPAEWAFYLLVLCGLRDLLSRIRVRAFTEAAPRYAFAAVALFIALYSGSRFFTMFHSVPTRPWAGVAAFVERHTAPDARIFLEHIGLVGFKTNRYIYDSMGLVTPATVTLKRAHGHDWLPKATRQFSADVVLYYRNDAPDLASPTDPAILWIAQNYSRVATFDFSDPIVDVYFLNSSKRLLGTSELASSSATELIVPPKR